MTSELDASTESGDRTRYVWAGVLLLVVLMTVVIYFSRGQKPNVSQVLARHILISFDKSDPADRREALKLIEELRARIVAGEDFASIAKTYSEDPSSAARGGLLSWQPKGEFDEAFDAYVWSAPVRELSPVITTSFGYHLIIVEDRHLTEADQYEMELERQVREENSEEGE